MNNDQVNTPGTAVTHVGSAPPPKPGQDPLISLRGVDKAFGDHVIYENLNLDIIRGETLCLIGPSGVGKSVAMKMIIGLLHGDKGELWFDGEDVMKLDDDIDFLPIRKRVAMVFQGAALFDSMTVYDNIAYPLREQMDLSEKEIGERVAQKLEWVGLPGIENQRPSELSGGMKKRVGLARSIATDPEVILYDEPTTGLDPVNTKRIGNLILSLSERLKCTSLVVTHDMGTVWQISDRVAYVNHKHIAAIGSAEEMKNGSNQEVRDFIEGTAEDVLD